MQSVFEVLDSYYLRGDAEAIDRHFAVLLERWGERLHPYRSAVSGDFTFACLPLLVNKAFRFLGNDTDLSLAMANIFKTVYFANTINQTLRDDAEGQQHDQEMQFSILISDYIFGWVLKKLVECNAAWLLDKFAGMMAEINEGFILKHCRGAGEDIVREKTRIPLYATAFYAAGRTAGCEPESALAYSRIGSELGMVMELYAANDARYSEHLLQADAMLQNLNIRNRNYEHDLCRLVDMLAGNYRSDGQIAAV